MRSLIVALFAVFPVIATTSVCHGEPQNDQSAIVSERELVGQLLLPSGRGSRAVEIVVTVIEAGSEPRDQWILFDEKGRLSGTFRGSLSQIRVSTGLRAELHRIETQDLPQINQAGQIDVGVIELRDRLTSHRMVLRAAEGAPHGDVRVALCFGPPPVGPSGEPVSLGSRQFPPVALGSEVEWLLPLDALSIYFLVERPVGSAPRLEWRGGHQRLFGPFNSADLPTELFMD